MHLFTAIHNWNASICYYSNYFHNTDGLQTVFSFALHERLTMFQLYLCIDSMTLHIDYHRDDFPGSDNLPLLYKVSLYDKKH